MAKYRSHSIKVFASVLAPLHELTKKNALWHWGTEQAKVLQSLKDSLTSETVMSYFDPVKDTELDVDASPVGLGAILYQRQKEGEGHTIANASSAFSEVESRYSQTE